MVYSDFDDLQSQRLNIGRMVSQRPALYRTVPPLGTRFYLLGVLEGYDPTHPVGDIQSHHPDPSSRRVFALGVSNRGERENPQRDGLKSYVTFPCQLAHLPEACNVWCGMTTSYTVYHV